MISALIESMRPKQWTKNLLIFAGIVFSLNLFDPHLFLKVILAFGIFCLLSGAGYLINDVKDLKQDRAHPLKSRRPLPSGRLKVPVAIVSAILISGIALPLSFLLNRNFGLLALSYLLIIVSYSFWLKHIVILDILAVSFGFILRAVAGAVVIDVTISPWLVLCTLFLALFIVMSKRRHELSLLGENLIVHRRVLCEYNPHLLDQMVAIVTASTLTAYALYTTSPETVSKFGTGNMIFTFPFVLYGIFRYLYLVHTKNMGGNPELVFIKDQPMVGNIILYLIVVIIVLYLK
ncbi:decaprenyl-phosphate phosphoribosyltransferase [candidate division WOR-3 bacterium]|nr:decaprenyl-phosphate phosphoribosyltransferase [candidate division WOR-3 bacterium]